MEHRRSSFCCKRLSTAVERGPCGLPGRGVLELDLPAVTCRVLSRARYRIRGLPRGLDQAAALSLLGHHLLPNAPHAWA